MMDVFSIVALMLVIFLLGVGVGASDDKGDRDGDCR